MPPQHQVIWLLRTLKPDFKTIADFRSDNRPPSALCSASSRCCAGTQSFRARAAGGGRHAHQGGQQQGPQLYEELAGEVHQGGGQASGRIRNTGQSPNAALTEVSSKEYETNLDSDDLAHGNAQADQIIDDNLSPKGNVVEPACLWGNDTPVFADQRRRRSTLSKISTRIGEEYNLTSLRSYSSRSKKQTRRPSPDEYEAAIRSAKSGASSIALSVNSSCVSSALSNVMAYHRGSDASSGDDEQRWNGKVNFAVNLRRVRPR